jgi:hypothetical protein
MYDSQSTPFSGQLSDLSIDVAKNWAGFSITNVGAFSAASLAASVATVGLDLTGASAIQFTEAATIPGGAPAPSRGKLWLKSGTPNTLWFDDDNGGSFQLGAGGGSVDMQDTYDADPNITTVDGTMVDFNRGTSDNVFYPAIRFKNLNNAVNGTPADEWKNPGTIVWQGESWNGNASATHTWEAQIETQGMTVSTSTYTTWAVKQRYEGGAWSNLFEFSENNGYTTLAVRNTNYLALIGTSSSRGLTNRDDFCCGEIEVNSFAYLENTTNFYGAGRWQGNYLTMYDNIELEFGSGRDASLTWTTADSSNHALVLGLGNTSKVMIVCDRADGGTDWNLSAFVDPTIVWQGNSTTTANRGYVQYDDANTRFVIASVTGDVYLNPAGSVRFGTHTGTGDTAISGYITINDAGGTPRKLAVIT